MVGHELISSTSATPATNASTMKTSSRVTPRNSRSLGRRPNLLVSQARLRCPAPPRARDTRCCMQSPLHNIFLRYYFPLDRVSVLLKRIVQRHCLVLEDGRLVHLPK